METRQIIREKAEKVKEIESLFQRYNIIGVSSLKRVRATQLQELRKKLRENVVLKVIKNTMVKRAISGNEEKKGLKEFGEYINGSNILLFTNLNPFKLVLLLKKSKIKSMARTGDTTTEDVIIPAGNTGLPPGPIISEFGSVGLLTRIEGGSVWINRDTDVAKKGEVVSMRLANVLSKLGIKTVDSELIMNTVYDNGIVITEDQLLLDPEETRRRFKMAQTNAFNLSVNSEYPLPENINILIQVTHQEAITLALNLSIPSGDIITALLWKAHTEASKLQMYAT